MNGNPFEVGDTIDTWFNHEALVLDRRPYTGRYPELFKWVYKVTAPKTRRGYMEIVIEGK